MSVTNPLRILIDARVLHGQKRGIEYYLEHLVQALAAIDTVNQYTLFYVSGRADRSLMLHLPQANFRTRCLQFPNPRFVQIFQDSSVPYKLLRTLSRGYDLVHEPGFEPLPLAPRLVLTLHDLTLFKPVGQTAAKTADYYQRRQRESARNATQIITDSEYTRHDAIEILGVPPEKVQTVYLGVSAEAFKTGLSAEEEQRELTALGIVKPYLLSIGDFYHRKNYINAVRGFARLPLDVRSMYQYIIAGAQVDTVVASDLQAEIVASELQGQVLTPGYVSHTARQTLMVHASALAYPSIYEGFGLPPLEAMVCGVPTASADNTSIPEVVGDAGLLVQDYLDPDAWTDALARVLTDEILRSDLISRGRARAATFTWERTARETLKVYEKAGNTAR